jgi:acid phosphatase
MILPGVAGLLAGLLLASRLPVTARDTSPAAPAAAPQAPAAFRAEVPAFRGLDANLYMQTAAEYRACCYQAYNLAARRLKELLGAPGDNGKKPAVVMDLDETVLDNAGFQAMLLRSGLAYDQRLWDLWEEKNTGQLGLIPGAGDFIREAERLGVTVVHISNRSEKYRAGTEGALARLGIPVRDRKQLKLFTKTSDKTERRKEAEAEYRVLLYVGDNLRDFDERFRCDVDNTRATGRTRDPAKLAAAIAARKDQVDRTREKWGAEWIILPNPAYGEWTKPLGLGMQDLDRLVPPAPGKP